MKFFLTPELKEQWCQALESGEYKQGHYKLETTQEGQPTEYCCLGVLGKIANFKSESVGILCSVKNAEFAKDCEFLDANQQCELYGMNDAGFQGREGKPNTFKDIAKHIRANIQPNNPEYINGLAAMHSGSRPNHECSCEHKS